MRATLITFTVALLSALLLALAGCGGGEEEDRATTEPVDCRARPELCR